MSTAQAIPDIEHLVIGPEHYSLVAEEVVAGWLNSGTAYTAAMRKAFHAYAMAAIEKGVPLDQLEMPTIISQFGHRAVRLAVAALPDKLSRSSRRNHSRAERSRPPMPEELRRLFANSEDIIHVALADDAKPVDVRIADFIERHNRQATTEYEKARERGERTAGQPINQRQINRDPSNPAKLLTQSPKTGRWDQSRKLAAFLYEIGEWGLADDFQLHNSQQTASSDTRSAALRDIANREPLNINLLSPEDIAAGIAINQRLIGEASSGQRWTSCMREDGANFRYLRKDVEANTIVVFLGSRQDAKCRYPLARAFLKPYYDEKGNTIWVPGKIYGAASGAIYDGFASTLRKIANVLNQGKSGTFVMDKRLYADGQPTTVYLQDAFTNEQLELSIREYRANTLADLTQELNGATEAIRLGESIQKSDVGSVFANDYGTIHTYHNKIVTCMEKGLHLSESCSNKYYELRHNKLCAFGSDEKQHDAAISRFIGEVRDNVQWRTSSDTEELIRVLEGDIRFLSKLITGSQTINEKRWRQAMFRRAPHYIGYANGFPDATVRDIIEIAEVFLGFSAQHAWRTCSLGVLAKNYYNRLAGKTQTIPTLERHSTEEDQASAVLAVMELAQNRKTKEHLERKIRTLNDPVELARGYFRLMRKTTISSTLPAPLEILELAHKIIKTPPERHSQELRTVIPARTARAHPAQPMGCVACYS